MSRKHPEFDDVPGTFVFDGEHSRKGYHLNMFCMSLNDEANRDEFAADEAAYLDKFDMTDEQKQAVLDRDYLRMLELGGNIYYTYKVAAFDHHSFQYVGAQMSGITEEEFVQMMLEGGRKPNG